MSDKVCIVTGANTGLGKAIATGLARSGATVVLVCRDKGRGEAARAEIASLTGNKAVEVIQVDLSSLQSVREGVAAFKAHHQRLDVLVNNAGVFKRKRLATVDALETMFVTNHLGPFILTHLLLDELKASPDGRIVNITAPSTVSLNFDDLQGEKSFSALSQFGATKMCNLLFTYELARRLAGTAVTANAVHPGLVKSNIMQEAPFIMRWFTRLISTTPDKGAETPLHVALSPDVAGVSGKFFKDKNVIQSNAYSMNSDVQQRLWEVSVQLAGLA